MKNIFKSIWACVAGIAVGVVLSLGTDQILEHTGVLPYNNLWVAPALIIFVLFYRTVYNVIGSYVVARLAPSKPMSHALIVGVLGTIATIAGGVATWNMDLGPHWYCIVLAILSLPSSWLGGKLFILSRK